MAAALEWVTFCQHFLLALGQQLLMGVASQLLQRCSITLALALLVTLTLAARQLLQDVTTPVLVTTHAL